MPTKRLPSSADLDYLKHQAKNLLGDFRNGRLSAFQRIREFHPKFSDLSDTAISECHFRLVDAQLSIACEYGFPNWIRLSGVVAQADDRDSALIHNERVEDVIFRRALDFMDEGNDVELREYLLEYPDLVHQHVVFEGDNYFCKPTLIEFVAENPIRKGTIPRNVTEIAKIILDAGAGDNQASLDSSLVLTASGRLARELDVQGPLLDLLCKYGADANAGLHSALVHGEFDAARRLIVLGATLDLSTAAALNQLDDVKVLAINATEQQIQLGLALSALHGCQDVVRILLNSGADPNRYNPPGGHSHCTPLHSAAFAGHVETVKALVEAGARFDIGDIHRNKTALAWAEYAKQLEIVDYFHSRSISSMDSVDRDPGE